MTLIVLGVSHRSAPFDVLEAVALGEEEGLGLLDDVVISDHVAEAMVLSTCNRVEVYADVDRFHGAVEDIGSALAKVSGIPVADLVGHVYVHYDERAVHHLFSVAGGLDSRVLGEQQIIGQVRAAVRGAQEAGTAGRVINHLGQSALRVGKRVHTETAIDSHGASVVSVALDRAQEELGGFAGRRATVVGAGAMSSLAVGYLADAGLAELVLVNRTPDKAERLVLEVAGRVPARLADFSDLATAVRGVDLVVACTGATGAVLTAEHFNCDHRRVVVDLALPHDVDPAVGDLEDTVLIDLAALADLPGRHSQAADDAARMVDAETRAFTAAQAAVAVEPLVVSLRARADGLLDQEIARLRLRLPQLDAAAAAEVERAMRRAMSALLHTPTVRMKELAADPDGERFTAAVRALFDLDPVAVQVISTPPEGFDA